MNNPKELSLEGKNMVKEYKNLKHIIICDKCELPCEVISSTFPINNEGFFDEWSHCCRGDWVSVPKKYETKYENPVCWDCKLGCKVLNFKDIDVSECCGADFIQIPQKNFKKVKNSI